MTTEKGQHDVVEIAELHKRDTQDLYALLEDAQDSRSRISQRVDMDSQRVDLLYGVIGCPPRNRVMWWSDRSYASREAGLIDRIEPSDLSGASTHRGYTAGPELSIPDHQRLPRMPTVTYLKYKITNGTYNQKRTKHSSQRQQPKRHDPRIRPKQMMRQALLRNSTNGDGSHSSHGDNRRNVQTARPCFYADFMKCQPLNFKGAEGVVGAALTWWNGQIRTLGPEAYAMTWEVLKKKMTDKYCPQGEIKKLEIELWNLKVKGNDVPAYTERFQELTLICTKFVANETEKIDKYLSGLPDTFKVNVKAANPRH
ncbi:putative reverse transcriptase domain-containing protein [Tanacetum coccineum]